MRALHLCAIQPEGVQECGHDGAAWRLESVRLDELDGRRGPLVEPLDTRRHIRDDPGPSQSAGLVWWPYGRVAMLKWLRRLSVCRRQHEPAVAASMVWVSSAVLKQTVDVLQKNGTAAEVHEGVAYWAGRCSSAGPIITTCIAPAAKTTLDSFETSPYTNARVVAYLAGVDLELVGQVHSHPGSFVGHSSWRR